MTTKSGGYGHLGRTPRSMGPDGIVYLYRLSDEWNTIKGDRMDWAGETRRTKRSRMIWGLF